MKRKEAQALNEDGIRAGDWVAEQLRLTLQLLALDAQKLIDHFPPNVDFLWELWMEYPHFAESLKTYWEPTQKQVVQLNALLDCFQTVDHSDPGTFWTVDALFSDHRWNEICRLAKEALLSFEWPLEAPFPEPESRGWKMRKGEM